MRLGVRWGAGDPPHPSVPDDLHAAIAEAELALPEARSWTLTWLEGRPRCELGAGEVERPLLISIDASGVVRASDLAPSASGAEDDDEDDDWLG